VTATLGVALLVGATLGMVMGLLGGGGGVLGVPLLVFGLGLTAQEATTTSLVIVAAGALAAVVPHTRDGRVDWRTGLSFGLLGTVGAIVGSRLSVSVPERLLLGSFALLLVVAGWSMLRRQRIEDPYRPLQAPARWPGVVAVATGVGLTTGFFGVGGGFIVVPALVTALHFPVRRAAATSLVVILVNSVVSLLARGSTADLDLALTLTLVLAAAVGAVGGALLSPKIPAPTLRRSFGGLTVFVAVYVGIRAALID